MTITRVDETELLLPLHEGVHETPRWNAFLRRLLRRVQADHVALVVRRDRSAMRHAETQCLARDRDTIATSLGDLQRLDPVLLDELRPGRVYSAVEIMGPQDGPTRARNRVQRSADDGYGRVVCVSEPGGAGIWLIISRGAADFSAADSALLTNLAPHLAVTLRLLVLLETARVREALATAALSRAGIRWTAGDMQSPGTARFGVRDALEPRAPDDTTSVTDVSVETSLTTPMPRYRSAVLAVPENMVLTRSAMVLADDAADVLQAQFRLSAKEARLAIALAQGHGIGAAAQQLGLTIETARHYSKLLYSKTATRGQADLARLIWSGVAVLA